MDANDIIQGIIRESERQGGQSKPPKPITHGQLRYNKRLAELICDHIADGDTLKRALEKVSASGMYAPTKKLFWRWCEKNPPLQAKYDRARLFQGHSHADRQLELAEMALTEPKKATACKVAAEIYRWQAATRNPESYGTKIDISEKKTILSPEAIQKEIETLRRQLGLVHEDPVTVVSGERGAVPDRESDLRPSPAAPSPVNPELNIPRRLQ